MPPIDKAVNQASELLDRESVVPSTPADPGPTAPAAPVGNVQDTIQRFPMPGSPSFPDSVRQNERNNLVPQYRLFPPNPAPATNVEIDRELVPRVSGGGMIVSRSGGSSTVVNLPGVPGAPGLPGTPGTPGTPGGGIPTPPSDTGNLTASSPVAVSSVRKVLGGPAVISVETFGASGAGHQRGVVPDPGSVVGISRFLREDATFAAIPPAAAALEPVTNGDPLFPEIVFAGGDVVMA